MGPSLGALQALRRGATMSQSGTLLGAWLGLLLCCAAPSALVVARLCAAGREQGRELLRLVRAARLAFHSGLLPASFTVETAGAGRAMQLLLAHLHGMQAAVTSHSEVEGAASHRGLSQGPGIAFPTTLLDAPIGRQLVVTSGSNKDGVASRSE